MRLLRELGLAIPAQDALLSAGRAAGALGGKLSGAGGGGAFFMVAPDHRTAVGIARSIVSEAGRQGTVLAEPPRVIRT
jgi:mevalonate kinase